MTDPDKNLFAEERRERILALLSTNSRVLVNDLSQRFGVSAATMRSDLRELEAAGLLRRTHGGAVSVDAIAIEHTADENHTAKMAIGRYAAGYVKDGDVLFCDSGTTTLELVRALEGHSHLTIITNDLVISAEAERLLPDSSVMMLGGVIRQGFHYTMGTTTVETLRHLSAPVAYMAASAYSKDRGFTVHTLDLASFKQEMIKRSDRQVLMIDSSKFGLFTTATYAQLDDVSEVVTDSGISAGVRRFIESHPGGPKLTIVD